ncbi:MAG TPA: hypothetical protein VK558_14270 [Patescibacteria group bacterium]|nr:hypothetical protein [Patescibacteria group bacterium]
MLATLKYVLLTSLRDRLYVALASMVVAALVVSRLLAESGLVEGRQLSLAYASMSVRGLLVLGIVIFISFHVRRMYETREIETILSRPISRSVFVLSYAAGFMLVAAGLVVPTGVLMAALLQADGVGAWLWSASLMLECVLVVALALFCSATLGSAVASALACLGLYALARLSTFFLDIATSDPGHLTNIPGVGVAVHLLVTLISVLLPRLDLFGQTRWLIYGPDSQWGIGMLAAQTAVYLPVILAATILDLRRKRF